MNEVYEDAQRDLLDVLKQMLKDMKKYANGDTQPNTLNKMREVYDIIHLAQIGIEHIDCIMSDGEYDLLPKLREDLATLTSMESETGMIIKEMLITEKKPARRFRPPTEQEIVEYLKGMEPEIERQISLKYLPDKYFFDVDAFIAYYETRDWRLNSGLKMSNWKGAVRTWIANVRRSHTGG